MDGSELEEGEPVVDEKDEDRWFAAKRILKQKTVNRRLQYLVEYEPEAPGALCEKLWVLSNNVSLGLVEAFYRSHTKAGHKRKCRLKI